MKKHTVGVSRRAKDFVLCARGYAGLSAKQKVPAEFCAKSNAGFFPGRIEVRAARWFLKDAALSSVKSLQIEICDLRFRCTIMSYNKNTYRLTVLSAQFFRGAARDLTDLSFPPFSRRHGRNKP
jgi:hypothetical protein